MTNASSVKNIKFFPNFFLFFHSFNVCHHHSWRLYSIKYSKSNYKLLDSGTAAAQISFSASSILNILRILCTNRAKMASSVQGMRTFGDKPKAFQLEEGGELYYVGSEVYLFSES